MSSAAAERRVYQDRVVEGKRFVVAFLSGRLVGFVTDPTLYQRLVGFVTDPTKRATKRSSQFSSVTLASRIDPNFARIARNLPQPKFRKTLRETLAQGKGPGWLAVEVWVGRYGRYGWAKERVGGAVDGARAGVCPVRG